MSEPQPSHIYLPVTNDLNYGFVGSLTERYFYLGGRRAELAKDASIPGKVVLKMVTPPARSWGQVALDVVKIISYFTGIIPLIMYIANKIFRSSNSFEVPKLTKEQIIASITAHLNTCTKEKFQRYDIWGAAEAWASSFVIEGRIWVIATNRVSSEKSVFRLTCEGSLSEKDGRISCEDLPPGEHYERFELTLDEAKGIRTLINKILYP